MSKMKERRFFGETEYLLEQFIDNFLALAHCAMNKPSKANPYDVKVQNSGKKAVVYFDEELMDMYKEIEEYIKTINKKIKTALEKNH